MLERLRSHLPALVEVGCWAHGRRRFFQALGTDRKRALIGIGFISLLYDAHRAARDKRGVVDAVERRRASRPILARLLSWVRAERKHLE